MLHCAGRSKIVQRDSNQHQTSVALRMERTFDVSLNRFDFCLTDYGKVLTPQDLKLSVDHSVLTPEIVAGPAEFWKYGKTDRMPALGHTVMLNVSVD